MENILKIALVGNPNSGKSTLFNLLTGLRQKVGNYSGVTVERKTGKFNNIEIIDLPGLQTLAVNSIDESITRDTLLADDAEVDHVLYVVNGMQLESSLSLFTQLADLGISCGIVVNYGDQILEKGINLDVDKLASELGCPCMMLESHATSEIDKLKQFVSGDSFEVPKAFCKSMYDQEGVDGMFSNNFKEILLDDEASDFEFSYEDHLKRSGLLGDIIGRVMSLPSETSYGLTEKLDKYLIHPFWGLLVLMATLFVIFQSIYNMAQWPMELIDGFFGTLSDSVINILGDGTLPRLIAHGIIPGVGGVLIFIPQIVILFLFIGVLESTGYLARISLLSDRLLSRVGLNGSSVIPLMSGLACAIPSIMSTRIIKDPRVRISSIFIAPLMTCSAKLPVFVILIGLLVPDSYYLGVVSLRGLVLFGLYILGFLSALVLAWITNLVLAGKSIQLPWVIELPDYRMPNFKNIITETLIKTKSFVVDAGKVIFVISIILWVLSNYSPHSQEYLDEQYTQRTEQSMSKESIELEYSYMGYMGKAIEPAIEPMGFDWKIGIALLTSFAAREVFVGSLTTIYNVKGESDLSIIETLRSEPSTTNSKYSALRFDFATAMSLLMFYVFAMQCMSTLAMTKKETGGWKWPMIQFFALTGIAYLVSTLTYQLLV